MSDRRGTVTEKDREHFRRWGEWKREGHEAATRENLARTAEERLIVSLAVAIGAKSLDRWGRKFDVPLARYTRAKELGLARR